MILVFGKDNDPSIRRVLTWLDYYGEAFVCSGSDVLSIEQVSIHASSSDFVISVGQHKFLASELKAVWYRSNWIAVKDFFFKPEAFVPQRTPAQSIDTFLSNYWYAHEDLIEKILDSVRTLGKNREGRFSKLYALHEATKLGLDVPDTLYSTSKIELMDFYERHKTIISKSFDIAFTCNEPPQSYASYTSLVTTQDIQDLPDHFFPSVFQRCIEKAYEVRTFYLDGRFFSTAIISQANAKTQVDYRKYDTDRMNRNVPVLLPQAIECKIKELMEKCDLKTGSIDLIRGLDGKYYFLEVNPVGQFGYPSAQCNYQLHRKIANYLSNYGNDK